MLKEQFVSGLYEVPETLLNRLLGTFTEIAVPETEADSIIAMGQLSANLNNLLLMPLSGLDIVELLLRVGQKNSTSINHLLSNLEFIKEGEGRLTVISPTRGQVVEDPSIVLQCKGDDISAVLVTILPFGMELTLEESADNAGTWEGGLTDDLPGGAWTANFVATFADGEVLTVGVPFTMQGAEVISTYPEAGQTYNESDMDTVEVTLNNVGGALNETVAISIFGVSVTATKTSGSTYVSDTLTAEFLNFVGVNIMTVAYMAADGSQTKDIEFTLELL